MDQTPFDSLLEDLPPHPPAAPLGPFSAPAIAEVLVSLSRSLNPRWRQCYGPPAPPVAPDRAHAALRLGIMTAELMLAAHARDDAQTGTRLSDAAAVEKLLGISETTRPRHLLLQTLGESGEWDAFRRSLEALTEEQQLALQGQRDPDLARLLPVAAWLRILEVEATLLADQSAPTLDPVGVHPLVLAWLENQLAQIDQPIRENRSVARCIQLCERVQRLLQRPNTEASRRSALSDILQTTLTRLLTP